jgi:hypothetical protein
MFIYDCRKIFCLWFLSIKQKQKCGFFLLHFWVDYFKASLLSITMKGLLKSEIFMVSNGLSYQAWRYSSCFYYLGTKGSLLLTNGLRFLCGSYTSPEILFQHLLWVYFLEITNVMHLMSFGDFFPFQPWGS